MPETPLSGDGQDLISLSLAQSGIVLDAVHRPRTGTTQLKVVLRVGKASPHELLATVASLLRSSCHDFLVDFAECQHSDLRILGDWLDSDSRFSFAAGEAANAPSQFTLVLGAGTILGTHSIAGLLQASEQTGATVIRILVDGQRVAPEFWDSSELDRLRQLGDPEQLARQARRERWISSDTLGMHDYSKPKPKQYLIKGDAGVPEIRLEVRDHNNPGTRADYETQLRSLRSQLRRAQIESRRSAVRNGPSSLAQRSRAVLRRGPKYMALKLRERMLRVAR